MVFILKVSAWPPVDIRERKDAYVVAAEIPGGSAKDAEITFEDGILTIQGEPHFASRTEGERRRSAPFGFQPHTR
jgi:HSP20 family protein